MMWQEQLFFTNQETGIAQQMSSEQLPPYTVEQQREEKKKVQQTK